MLRGHLVDDDIHRRALRRKAELRLERGRSVTWSVVVTEALSAFLAGEPTTALDIAARSRDDGRRRLVQATIPAELERDLIRTHLALNEGARRPVTYEQLWEAALATWLSR